MISFKQYLLENASGNYASIGVDNPLTIPVLEVLFGGSHVCEPNDQHVTLIYSKQSNVPIERVQRFLDKIPQPIKASITGVAAFDAVPKDGERDEKKCTIVLKINSPVLNDIHEQLKDLGLKHSYEDFSPHVSLLYDIDLEKKQEALSTIKKWLLLNPTTFSLSGFKSNPIIKDWHKKVSE